jgi:hypothetical protein
MAGGRKSDLEPWRAGAVLQELVSHAALLGVAWISGLGYIGMMLILACELVLVNLLSTAMFPERGLLKHIFDLVKFIPVMAFLLLFVVLTYGVANEGELTGDAAESPFGLLQFDASLLQWTLGFSFVHLGTMFLYARTRPDPRLEWARMALMQSAVTFLAIFFSIFVVAFAGPFAIAALRHVADAQTIPGDQVLCALAVAVRLGFALLMSRMPDKDIQGVARNPYVS